MAGIGFELNRILARQTYTTTLQAYAYAGLVGSGPWLIAILSIGLLGLVLRPTSTAAQTETFFVSMSLIYALSLVLTGPIQLVLTRHAADQQFEQRMENVFPAFVFALAWVSLLFSVVGLIVFVGFVPGPLLFRMAAAMVLVLVADIWIAGIFLTAIKKYHLVLLAFAGGCGVSFLAAWALAELFGLDGAMLGFALGQALLLVVLCTAIFKEMGNLEFGRPEFLGYFRRYWDLALGGAFYNLGIWIDKFLFWWLDPHAQQVVGILHAAPIYDRVVYFSFLTIVPGMAVFLLKLETAFAIKNELFIRHVLHKGTLGQIQQYKREIIDAFRDGFVLLVKVQGLCTILLILSAHKVLRLLGLGAVQSGVFQVAVLGAFVLVLFLALLTVLYYLDKRRDALLCTVVFTLTSASVTAWGLHASERWHGFGFLVAAGVATALAATKVNRHLTNLDYDVFTSQPVYG